MKVSIFGAGGFIGYNLLLMLSELDEVKEIIAFGHDLKKDDRCSKIKTIEADFLNSELVEAALDGSDIAYHLIYTGNPVSGEESLSEAILTNVIPTINFFNLASKSLVKRLVFVSSGGTVYGEPLYTPIKETHQTYPKSNYGLTKLISEQCLRYVCNENSMEYTIARVSNPFGPHQRGNIGLINQILSKIAHSEELIIRGDGNNVRDYIYIDDLIKGLFYCGVNEKLKNEVVNIGSEKGYSNKEIIEMIFTITNKRPLVKYIAPSSTDVSVNVLNCSKFRRMSGWTPKFTLEEGIKRFIDYLEF